MTDGPLLEVAGLEKHFDQSTSIVDTLLRRDTGTIQAVDGVSFTIGRQEIHGLIGESGCGKSTLAKVLIGLHSPTGGEVRYKGQDFGSFSKKDWRQFRRNTQMIFQDPFNSLNPKMTVGESIRDLLDIHDMNTSQERVDEALRRAELRPAERYRDSLPRELSGGEKQRASIARALSIEPEILLADEPVSMLDVSTQASILNLLSDLKDEMNLSILYVSHDISTVASLCDEVKVMYLGRIVESAPTAELITNPKHPYTDALINAVPRSDPYFGRDRTAIEGNPRDPIDIGEGCRFRDRCPERMDICDVTPEFREVANGHETACHLHYDHEVDQREPVSTEGER
jgi:peptide/nickel transport system ATP-binding protein